MVDVWTKDLPLSSEMKELFLLRSKPLSQIDQTSPAPPTFVEEAGSRECIQRPRGQFSSSGKGTSKHKDQARETMSSAKEAVVPSDLFPHVHAFLVECNLTKAAKSLKKECKVVSSGRWFWESVVYTVPYFLYAAVSNSERSWINGLLSTLPNKVYRTRSN